MKTGHLLLAGAAALAAIPSSASAITWTDWTQAGAGVVTGTAGAVNVTFAGSYGFAQTNGGTDFWNGSFHSSWDGTIAPPPDSDIIALNGAGSKTITFSAPVQNVFLAIASWNGQANVSFDQAFSQIGWVNGCGYWGCGQLSNVTATSFTSNGESHGILQFAGPITSLTITDSNDEFWHGIQVGVGVVPEPSAWALMILGFGAVGAGLRRRRAMRFSFA